MNSNHKHNAIIFCVEKGFLEPQAQLLVESFKRFAADPDTQLFAYSPRKNFLPGQATCDFLKNHGVVHICDNLNVDFLEYPIANKILACRHFEIKFTEYKSVMFVDTDTVFFNPIDFDLFKTEKLYLRPTGHKGPGSSGEFDEKDEYWQRVFSLFDLPLPAAEFKTSIHQVEIRPYFNAGLVWVNGLNGFYQQWEQDFLMLYESKLRPVEYVSKDDNNFRCLDQVALAVTATRYQNQLEILPFTYNVHLPFRPMMKGGGNEMVMNEMVHVHYHKWFQHQDFLAHISTKKDTRTDQYKWLQSKLPLEPLIDDEFKC